MISKLTQPMYMLDPKGSTYDFKQTTLLSSSPRTIEFRKNLALAELELSRAIGLCVVAVAYYILYFYNRRYHQRQKQLLSIALYNSPSINFSIDFLSAKSSYSGASKIIYNICCTLA